MKILFWSFVVTIGTWVPGTIRLSLCRILLSSLAKGKDGSLTLQRLFLLDDVLQWHIDQVAIRNEGGIHPKHRLMSYHDFFVQRIEPGENVLDIGCGYGAVSASMAKAGINVTGIDMSEQNIQKAKKIYAGENLRFLVGDVNEYAPDQHYDVLVMSNVLEHIELRVALLRRLVETIGPKSILIRVPMRDRHWTVPMRDELGIVSFCDPTHHVEYTLLEFFVEMEQAGLVVQEYQVNWGEIWAKIISP